MSDFGPLIDALSDALRQELSREMDQALAPEGDDGE